MENKKENYISLREATKYCSYSQEYLSLRARQGKLKARKIGRNWFTKKEWLQEYLEKVGKKNKEIKKSPPPPNLPVSSFSLFLPKVKKFPLLIFCFIFFFFFFSFLIQKNSKNLWLSFKLIDDYFLALEKFNQNLEKFTQNTIFYLDQLSQANSLKIQEIAIFGKDSLNTFLAKIELTKEALPFLVSNEVLAYTSEIFREYFRFLNEKFSKIFISDIGQFFQEIKKIPTFFPQTKAGIKEILWP